MIKIAKNFGFLTVSISMFLVSCVPGAIPDGPKPPPTSSPQKQGDLGTLSLAFNFEEGVDLDNLEVSDFFEIKGFHISSPPIYGSQKGVDPVTKSPTLGSIHDISKIRIKVENARMEEPIVKEFERSELVNGKTTAVINNLPVGPTEVSVELKNKNAVVLAEDTKPVKVVANKVIPVDFELTLINNSGGTTESPVEEASGGIAINIKVKEETRLFGQVEVSKPTVNVGESMTVRATGVQGTAKSYEFDLGDSKPTKTSSNGILPDQKFDQPGRYPIKVRIEDEKGEKFTTQPVYVKVNDPDSKGGAKEYTPSVTVTSDLNPNAPVALQGKGTFSQNGTGFPPNISINLHFQRPNGQLYPLVPKQTNGSGSFQHQWSPSVTAEKGTYHYWASYSYNSQKYETGKVSYRVDEAAAEVAKNPPPNFSDKAYSSPINPYAAKYRGQCTWFAFGRAYEKLGIKLTFKDSGGPHAKYWYAKVQNLLPHNTPKANSVAVWTGGDYGHVAFVERVEGDKIIFREANWPGSPNGQEKTFNRKDFEKRGNFTIIGYLYKEGNIL